MGLTTQLIEDDILRTVSPLRMWQAAGFGKAWMFALTNRKRV